MAPKKRQMSVKQNLQFARHFEMKSPDRVQGKASLGGDEDDDGALEMERNFALLSKRGPGQQSEMPEKETCGEESNEDDENAEGEKHEGEDVVKERGRAERTDSTASDESHNQRRNKLKPDLSTLSFEEILQLQSKIGTKACNKLSQEVKKRVQNPAPANRVTRDRPEEISAKKPVSFLRKLGSFKKPILRDPRFDDLSGEFKPEVFNQTYRFISDIRHREAEVVKKKLKKVKSNAKKEELKVFLKRMENQQRNQQRQQQQREKELHYKRKQRALVADGHKPFYLKKSDKKKLQLAEKYNELKKSGKLEHFLSKKRKRNAVKDRRKLP